MVNAVKDTLEERGGRYGKFKDQARLSVQLKDAMRFELSEDCTGMSDRPGWKRLAAYQKNALDFIMEKVSRILSGDPNYKDNWHDIQGYAKLVEDELNND